MRRFVLVLLIETLVFTGRVWPAGDGLAAGISSRVGMLNGRPVLFVNDRPEYPIIYALTDVPGGRWSWEEIAQHNIRNFCEAGVRFVQLDLFFDHCWNESGTVDVAAARRQIAGAIQACPGARVFLRFHVTAPRWWRDRHPEECVAYADVPHQEEDADGLIRIIEEDNNPVRRVSMASLRWRNEAGVKFKEFLAGLAGSDEGNALAGIQVANGVYGEWHNWGFYRNEPDISEPMNRRFREWLRDRYKDDRTLQHAWGRQDVTLASASVPDMPQRATVSGVFRDPAKERQTIDYYECAHQLVVDNILWFAKIVKQEWPRPIVTGTFYGYFFSVFGRQAAGGHLELHRLLASPDIDYLAGPQAYGPDALAPGDPYRSRALLTSLLLHGKLWLDEMDSEPTVPILRDKRRERYLRDAVANVRRNVTFSYTKGMGLWFYDFGISGVDLDGFRYNHRGSRGTWDHPVLMKEISSLASLCTARMASTYRTGADVLFVFDTRSFYYTASLRGTDPVSNVLIDHNTLTAFRSGVVFDAVHLQDLMHLDLAPYRVVVFGNTYLLTREQREFIRKEVAADGRTLVWFYAPGYTDGLRLDVTAMNDLTGIAVEPVRIQGPPEVRLTDVPDSLALYRCGDSTVAPLFAVTDPAVDVRGRFVATGGVAVARKMFPHHTAWFVSVPNQRVEPLRTILRESGAHVYVDAGEIVYAGGGILVMHTGTGGRHLLRLRGGRTLKLDLPEGASTVVVDAETGESLLP